MGRRDAARHDRASCRPLEIEYSLSKAVIEQEDEPAKLTE
jgi:hypothetical protein